MMELRQIVVYKNPKDYPGKFVATEWYVKRVGGEVVIQRGEILIVADTLEKCWDAIPEDKTCLQRAWDDDHCIIEVWV